jgi:hypothetical protein
VRKIFQIKIKNFKAFQNEQVFELMGKNILFGGVIFGEEAQTIYERV